MHCPNRSTRSHFFQTLVLAAILGFFGNSVLASEAKGTLTNPKGTVALKYAYFVKGPDNLDSQKILKRIVLSGVDIGAKIQACTTMSCVDGTLTEGVMVDLDGGPRMNYWMAINDAKVQYSGTHEVSALKVSADDAKHLAAKLSFDDNAMGGPKVDADFDAALLKEFTQAR